jgi:hypothetical protein
MKGKVQVSDQVETILESKSFGKVSTLLKNTKKEVPSKAKS